MSDPAHPLARLPSGLRANARLERLGPTGVPALIVTPPGVAGPAPVCLWMHGRTVDKLLDPGRYLRWMRAGIGVCAVDLPGHGERYDRELQAPARTFDVVRGMLAEVDDIVAGLAAEPAFDLDRMAIGGMSAGGMVTLARLCRPHRFVAASVEATTGSWRHQRERAMFRGVDPAEIDLLDPIRRLDGWREIPLQAFHSRLDEWVGFDGQEAFLDALRARYADPDRIELVVYEETGAPYEHAGFGRHAADAKNRQRDFLMRVLEVTAPA